MHDSYSSIGGAIPSMYFSPNLTSLPSMEYVFGLSTIYVPHSVTTIDENAFKYVYGVSKVVIDNTENAISGAPWGADDNSNVEVIWLRSE